MIQDFGNERLKNEYKNLQPEPEDPILIFQDRSVLLKDAQNLSFPDIQEFSEFARDHGLSCTLHYLFAIGKQNYFLALPKDEKEREDLKDLGEFVRLFTLRKNGPLPEVMAAATGYHLYTWYQANRYCGWCGSEMVHDEKERMLRCPNCNHLVFPKIAPAVIVGVCDGDRLLLTKYANREYKRYALIAGFTEIGETIEETVKREVLEETGLRVKNITYYKSQPWGFDSNLLMGFFCDLYGDDTITVQEDELSTARWVRAEDIPEYNEGLSLTEEMMMYFKDAF